MANSDNVLRGGLTPKHVDVDELLRVLTFEPTRPNQLASIRRSDVEQVYRAPVDEFEIARLTLGAGQTHAAPPTEGADLLLVFEGEVTILGAPRPLTLGRGGAALATHGLRYRVQAGTASLVFVVRVPSGRHA